jgi:hypothetical protein
MAGKTVRKYGLLAERKGRARDAPSEDLMQIPFNMAAPRMKLADGEQVIQSHPGLRRKGIFGNRYGELHVTNQRVAFVKAVMKGIVAAAASKLGVKPMLEFERSAITSAEKVPVKKQFALVITAGAQSEKIIMAPEAIDGILAAIKP